MPQLQANQTFKKVLYRYGNIVDRYRIDPAIELARKVTSRVYVRDILPGKKQIKIGSDEGSRFLAHPLDLKLTHARVSRHLQRFWMHLCVMTFHVYFCQVTIPLRPHIIHDDANMKDVPSKLVK